MSLELEIKKLKEAVVELTAILSSNTENSSDEGSEKVPVAPPPPTPDPIAPTPEDPPVVPPPPPTQPEDPVINTEQAQVLHDQMVLLADTKERAEKVFNLMKEFKVEAINDLRCSQFASFLGSLEGLKS